MTFTWAAVLFCWLILIMLILRVFENSARHNRSVKLMDTFKGLSRREVNFFIERVELYKETRIASRRDCDLQLAAKLCLRERGIK